MFVTVILMGEGDECVGFKICGGENCAGPSVAFDVYTRYCSFCVCMHVCIYMLKFPLPLSFCLSFSFDISLYIFLSLSFIASSYMHDINYCLYDNFNQIRT